MSDEEEKISVEDGYRGDPVKEEDDEQREMRHEVEDAEEEIKDEEEEEMPEDRFGGRDDDEEEDEDEDEEDEEDEEMPRRKKRKERRNMFLDVEAEVDEDEEDVEDDEADLLREDGFIQEEPEELEDRDDRLHREVDRRREAIVEEDAERLASEYREKYGRSTASKYRGDTGHVPQRLLLPSVHDPNIWGIRCKPGKEKELVRAILKKKINLQYTKAPLEIFSAFQRDTFTGYIYIEARKQVAVLNALKGFANVYTQNMVLVPIKEYQDMFRVVKSKETELTPGTYVRIKRGKYQGDLAIVENLSENGLEAKLKVVPRLDYGRSLVIDTSGGDNKRKRSTVRPPPKLFSYNEAAVHDQRNLQRRGPNSFVYAGDEYENGYLIKDFKITYLITENVEPRLEELTKFNNASEHGLDLKTVSESYKSAQGTTTFQPGDQVEVHSGEQSGMEGRVVGTQNSIITVLGTSGVLSGQKMDIPAENLRKKFSIGDHVRVMNGNYKDETGLVVQVNRDNVTLLSDLSKTEITVFAKDLKAASDIGGANTIGKFELHDLVQLNAQSVGCIVKIDRDSVGVLGMDGHLSNVSAGSINRMAVPRQSQFATDRNGQEIRVGDTVKELSGERRQGHIIHIYRSILFMHNRDIQENLGVFVNRITNVATVAAKGARGVVGDKKNGFPDLNKMNPNIAKNMAPPPVIRSTGRDRIIGQRITIGKGSQYKGLNGRVLDSNDTEARIELEAKSKVVNVAKTKLLFTDRSGAKIPYAEFVRNGRRPPGMPPGPGGGFGGGPGQNAWSGGGKTPSWGPGGGRTPYGGGQTPGWNGSGGKTPAWGGGGKTPAWGGGGKTPAWNEGGKTPAWAGGGGGGGKTPAWAGGASNSGGKTPAWAGGKTPSWGDSSGPRSRPVEAPTPGFFGGNDYMNAPTPGFGAPTPGAMTAATPGVFDDTAPTPGATTAFDARTPAAAPTPGVWDDGETPKYDAPTP